MPICRTSTFLWIYLEKSEPGCKNWHLLCQTEHSSQVLHKGETFAKAVTKIVPNCAGHSVVGGAGIVGGQWTRDFLSLVHSLSFFHPNLHTHTLTHTYSSSDRLSSYSVGNARNFYVNIGKFFSLSFLRKKYLLQSLFCLPETKQKGHFLVLVPQFLWTHFKHFWTALYFE